MHFAVNSHTSGWNTRSKNNFQSISFTVSLSPFLFFARNIATSVNPSLFTSSVLNLHIHYWIKASFLRSFFARHLEFNQLKLNFTVMWKMEGSKADARLSQKNFIRLLLCKIGTFLNYRSQPSSCKFIHVFGRRFLFLYRILLEK